MKDNSTPLVLDGSSKDFGNARTVRNIFEKTIENQSNRIAKEKAITKELLVTILDVDVIFYVD